MRSGRRRETPTMGVVVAVPDRRQLDLPPRSLVLFGTRVGVGSCGNGAAAPQGVLGAAATTHPRSWADLWLRSAACGGSPTLAWWRGLVARHKQGLLARAAVSRARRPALAVAGYPGAPWTDQTSERMLPLCGGGVHALQGRCREARAGPINGPPSQRVFRSARTTPVGLTHAVATPSEATASDATACGIPARRLHLLDQDWEASFIEKCPACFNAVLTDG